VADGGGGDCDAAGLPSFETASQLQAATKWAQYFQAVYGDIPTSGFPLCVADLMSLYKDKLQDLGLQLPSESKMECARDLASSEAHRTWHNNDEPPWLLRLVKYERSRGGKRPFTNDTWVEVVHRARSAASTWELNGMWFSVMSGTGVFFNTGRTISFRTHSEAIDHFGVGYYFYGAEAENELAVKARAQGYDTVQFLDCDGIQSDCCTSLGLGPSHAARATRHRGGEARPLVWRRASSLPRACSRGAPRARASSLSA
jgi:hypothetical protein